MRFGIYMAHQNVGCFGLRIGSFYIDTFLNNWSQHRWGIYIGTTKHQVWIWPTRFKVVIHTRGEPRRKHKKIMKGLIIIHGLGD